MRRISGLWVVVLALALGLAQSAQAATWTVVQNSNCTGIGTTSSTFSALCCTGAGAGNCVERQASGNRFTVNNVDLVGAGTYTVGGDHFIEITAAGVIGLGTITGLTCTGDTGAAVPVAVSPTFTRDVATPGTGLGLFTAALFNSSTQLTAISIAGYTLHRSFTGY